MDLLKAVNMILPYMEENVVTSVDISHPTVAIVLNNLDNERETLLQQGWWFNTETRTYYPTPTGVVEAPVGVFDFYTVDRSLDYVVRDGLFYDMTNTTTSIAEPFKAVVLVDLPFEQLPESAATVVVWRACMASYTPDFGVTDTTRVLQTHQYNSEVRLERDQLRHRRYSISRTRAAARYIRALRR